MMLLLCKAFFQWSMYHRNYFHYIHGEPGIKVTAWHPQCSAQVAATNCLSPKRLLMISTL